MTTRIRTQCECITFHSESTWLATAGIGPAGLTTRHICGNSQISYDMEQPFDPDHVLLII